MSSDFHRDMDDGLEKTLGDLKATITQTLFVPIHKAGWPFILGFAVVSILLSFLSDWLALFGLILTLWCVYFFRDPVRQVPQRAGLIVAPADGRVSQIAESVPLPKELRPQNIGQSPNLTSADYTQDEDGDYTRISIFLSVFDVHVNRIPVTGLIKKIIYKPGLFLNAGNDKASFENERCAVLAQLPDGRLLGFVQIAGLIARRIICDLKEDMEVKTGERFGIIRFGSRMDIYLPDGVAPMVAVGQRTIGGETILADLQSKEPARDTQPI
jgi:phosphatidylserine decarboxylase